MLLWTPDTCPSQPACEFEMEKGTLDPVRAVRLCRHHAAMGFATVEDAYAHIHDKMNVGKNRAVAEAQAALFPGQEDAPPIGFMVEPDETIRIILPESVSVSVRASLEAAIRETLKTELGLEKIAVA